jgi:hypothetical protein
VADPLIDARHKTGTAQTNKRNCGIQPANQSLLTDVFRSRSSARSIVYPLHAGPRETDQLCARCLTWGISIRRSHLARLAQGPAPFLYGIIQLAITTPVATAVGVLQSVPLGAAAPAGWAAAACCDVAHRRKTPGGHPRRWGGGSRKRP